MEKGLLPGDFFAIENFVDRQLFDEKDYVWSALSRLKEYVADKAGDFTGVAAWHQNLPLVETLILFAGNLFDAADCEIVYGDATKGKMLVYRDGELLPGASVFMAGAVFMGSRFSFGEGVLVESGALLKEPLLIGDNCEIRQGAYLRGNCVFGKRCVIGHTTEVKHSIFLNDAKAGHFAYLGDSILGNEVNLGAGTKCANLRFLPGNVRVKTGGAVIDSTLRKFGAILADNVQTGCNCVTSPGLVLGKNGIIMPNTTAPSGVYPPGSVLR